MLLNSDEIFFTAIFTSVLPALENIIYGDNVSVIIAKNTNIAKDLLAWIPYGILHFSLPFLTSLGIWLVGIKGIGIKGVLPVFSRAFGYMNIAGVLTQLIFPCSPPYTPASYSIPGEAGGLKRIDKLFNSTTYEKAFSGSPMVFGAFPSLHSACAILQILFISYTLQQHKYNNQIYFIGFLYVIWIWWACMYFTHHYMVDLVGGGIYAIASFWFSWKWLPQIVVIEDENDQNEVQSDVINITIGNDNDVMENIRSNNKFNNKRWEYEEVQKMLEVIVELTTGSQDNEDEIFSFKKMKFKNGLNNPGNDKNSGWKVKNKSSEEIITDWNIEYVIDGEDKEELSFSE
nr:10003_t:CDS:2 [Entrophospora candida]